MQIMARDGRNTQRTEQLTALAVYPLALGSLKTAFPAHCGKAHAAVQVRVPSQGLWAVLRVRVVMRKGGMAACLFSAYGDYTSKLAVNTHLHNEYLCVKSHSLHGKGCSICTYKLGAELYSLND